MQNDHAINKSYRLWIYGFIAGFFAVLTFHQGALFLLWATGIAPFGPFNLAATQPWGIPAVISLALWGGVWGIVFGYVQNYFPGKGHFTYWISAFLFGAIVPSLVALLMVLPLKGKPVGGGWQPHLLLTVFLINGTWAIGTGLYLRALQSMSKWRLGHHRECTPGMTC